MSYLYGRTTPFIETANCNKPVPSTCLQHCSTPDHSCSCCHQNITADTYVSHIVLHYIRADSSNTIHGTIYYDLDRDAVFFKNSRGEEMPMTQMVRNCGTGNNSSSSGISFNPVNRGTYSLTTSYNTSNLVYFGTGVYIAKRANIGSSPANHPLDWTLFFDIASLISPNPVCPEVIAPLPRGAWNNLTSYLKGNIVSLGARLYWAIAPSIGTNPVSSSTYWALYFDFTNLIPVVPPPKDCESSCDNDPCNVSDSIPATPITGADIEALSTPRHPFFEEDCEEHNIQEPVAWIAEVQFQQNDKTILDGELYSCLVSHRSSGANRPSLSLSTWKSDGIIKLFEHHVYLLFVQDTECIDTDPRTGCSLRKYVGRNQYDFDAKNPLAPINYAITYSSSLVHLPLTRLRYVVSINRNLFEAGNEIRILRTGWYRVSYSIAHSGSVRMINMAVFKGRGRNESDIEASHSEGDVDGCIRNTHHSFPVKLEAGAVIELRLSVMPTSRTHSNHDRVQKQNLRIYPHKTWLHVQTIE